MRPRGSICRPRHGLVRSQKRESVEALFKKVSRLQSSSQAHGYRAELPSPRSQNLLLPCSLRSSIPSKTQSAFLRQKFQPHNHGSSISLATGPPSPGSSSHQQMLSTPSHRRCQQQRQCLPECDVDARSSRSRDFGP